ncbi:MAG: GxxExxY protein [Isosphaeraceae bacterium]|nr:GxxExxY protein [Isosphaeraceae bacterium]
MLEEARSDKAKERADWLSNQIVGAAIEVHRALGPGLLESVYEERPCHELKVREIDFVRQFPLPVRYKGIQLDCGYRLDLIVGGLVIVELKSVERVEPIHEAQLLTYLRLTDLWLGLLINFNSEVLRNGVKRRVLG